MNDFITSRTVVREHSFSFLKFDRDQNGSETENQRNEQNQQSSGFQQMSVAVTEGGNMSRICQNIDRIQNDKTIGTKMKLEKIDMQLRNTQKEFLGYFFDYPSPSHSTLFRYVYLEVYDGNLDSFINTSNIEAQQNDTFDWTVLPELCNQLVKAINWLHQTNITYDGNLHPRNIFIIKRSNVNCSENVLRLVVPQEQNPFSKSGLLYSSVWSGAHLKDAVQKDFASMAILVYFIQSLGNHPFQTKTPKSLLYYEDLSKGMKTMNFNLNALENQCFCHQVNKGPVSPCDKPSCKYRYWVNSLAKDWVNSILDPLFRTQQVSCGVKGHPFFWETGKILHFLQMTSSYLREGGGTPASKPSLDQHLEENIMNILKTIYPNIIQFIHENTRRSEPVEISKFENLIHQIRNKSCHWYEGKSKYRTGAQNELEKIVFVNPGHSKMDVFPEKYCLFWMIYFPELLLYTWDKLKGVDLHY